MANTKEKSVISNFPHYKNVALLICPTGTYCREDRCQSYFKFSLIPSMRAPLEECELAGAISVLNSKATIVDAPAMKINLTEFLGKIKVINPDFIILAVTFGTLDDDLECAKKIRAMFPNVPIGLRGAPCYVNADKIIKHNKCIDICFRGDYELAIEEVLKNGIQGARGCIYRDPKSNSIIVNENILYASDLDSLPFPDRTSINQNLYSVRGFSKTQATIHVQRGCPFPCSYCLVHTVSGSKARHRSAVHIVQEIKALIAEGINYFYFRAETFTLNRKWVLELCKLLAKEAPKAKWVTTTRIELVDAQILSAMKSAGCYGISFGIDVASKKIAEKVNKTVDPIQVKNAMRLCDKHGIISLAYIMIGFVWDTVETIAEAKALISKIRADLVTVHFAHPYPGTKYYEDTKNYSLKLASDKAQSEPAFSTEHLSTKELESAANGILLKHYLRLSVIFSFLKKALRNFITS